MQQIYALFDFRMQNLYALKVLLVDVPKRTHDLDIKAVDTLKITMNL